MAKKPWLHSSQVDWSGPESTKANHGFGRYNTHPNKQPSGAASRPSGAEESVSEDGEGVELSKRKLVPLEALVELEREDGRVRGTGRGGWTVRWDMGCICD